MVSLAYPNSPNYKSPSPLSSSPSSITSTMKLKTLIHNFIISHIYRIARAFSKTKSIILELFKGNQLIFLKQSHKKSKQIYRNKILFGSFRLHYNWCSSSHVLPILSSPSNTIIFEGKKGNSTSTASDHIYYESSTWNSIFSTNDNDNNEDHQGQFGNLGNKEEREEEEGELSRYLQWLEEKGGKEENPNDGPEANIEEEIDKLADMFIANCHEKFRLEKIESYRRYQEMLARSM